MYNYDLNDLQGVRELFKIKKVWKNLLTNFTVIMHITRLPEVFFFIFKALTRVTIRLLQFKFQFHTITTVPHFTYIYRNVYILQTNIQWYINLKYKYFLYLNSFMSKQNNEKSWLIASWMTRVSYINDLTA